ncbi:S8 family serine peptidase (plasmid) [Rhizobium leguminosarum bv. viciae]|nr:S8 family serine peptidase [Rhizobium leguminosarum bv. viciae]
MRELISLSHVAAPPFSIPRKPGEGFGGRPWLCYGLSAGRLQPWHVLMTYQSTKTIRADEARKTFGVEGEGIVWAVVDSGVQRGHVHFQKHNNLTLPAPLRHLDFSDPELPEDLREQEALVDSNGHGTFNAGIVAGDSSDAEDEPCIGVAPKCKILSLKVISESGEASERNVIAALRWIRSVNEDSGRFLIHGALLNLAIQMDLQNFACGGTPICDEVNDLVRSGVVVVVPAGNFGMDFERRSLDRHAIFGGITDPGNAALAITVGSTGRRDPQAYGASYFSSRGPTFDGRLKPDVLAPGERIASCSIERDVVVQGKRSNRKKRSMTFASYTRMEGTSMAASHVAGAAALLLSARPELIGRPADVKQIFMDTATDLKRVPWAQGSGVIDVHHAFERAVELIAVPAKAPAAQPLPTERRGPGEAERKGRAPEATTDAPVVSRTGKRFSVAISYPGTHRELVKNVVYALRDLGLQRGEILYDKFLASELAIIDLDIHLMNLYTSESDLVVVFLGGDFEKSTWCGLEWRAVRQLIKDRKGFAVMPLRLDMHPIPGLLDIDGYMDISKRDPEYIADRIFERLKIVYRDTKR